MHFIERLLGINFGIRGGGSGDIGFGGIGGPGFGGPGYGGPGFGEGCYGGSGYPGSYGFPGHSGGYSSVIL